MNDESGAAQELANLYDLYAVKAYRYAKGMGLSAADADDIVSECFVRIIESYKNYRGDSAFDTWLFAVIRNAVLNAMRGAKRQSQLHERLPARSFQNDDPHVKAEQKEFLNAMSEAVEQLTPENRSALALVAFAGLSLRDAARVENITEAALTSRLFQARKSVRARLASRQLMES